MEFFGPAERVSFWMFFPKIHIFVGVSYRYGSVTVLALMHKPTTSTELKTTDLTTRSGTNVVHEKQ